MYFLVWNILTWLLHEVSGIVTRFSRVPDSRTTSSCSQFTMTSPPDVMERQTMTSSPSVTKRKVQTTPIPQVGTCFTNGGTCKRYFFGSASTFSSSSYHCNIWMKKRKRNKKILSTNTINLRIVQ